jgi:hypothetical protein
LLISEVKTVGRIFHASMKSHPEVESIVLQQSTGYASRLKQD